jgi:hypothetical protein
MQKGSILSGNTFGSKLYSDGRRISPMLPEFPYITKCKKCETIFWLDETSEEGVYSRDWENNTDFDEPDRAEFLNIQEYLSAIEKGLARNNNELLYLRQRIWWLFNDRTRDNQEIFKTKEEEAIYRENCNGLLAILDKHDLNQKIMAAEVKRNLGDFDACLDIIETIDHDGISWLKDIFIRNCKEQNRLVVVLDS